MKKEIAVLIFHNRDRTAKGARSRECSAVWDHSKVTEFLAVGSDLGNLFRLAGGKSRSVSPENLSGAKGKGGMSVEGVSAERARDLGQGWKISPYVKVKPGETFVLADIEGSGAIQQFWITMGSGAYRHAIIRAYWDEQTNPSVECPLGDFFACGWDKFAQISSLAICVNPARGLNCYWPMPFRKRAKWTLSNLSDTDLCIFYQLNYTEAVVPSDAAYFHAQFRRTNPVPYKGLHTIVDGVRGRGHFVGTYMAWGVNNCGWWGEGEIKFHIDGDDQFPTICGTGTEDYFGGSHNFDLGEVGEKPGYVEFTTPYSGMPQVIRPDGLYHSQQRFGLYRWHLTDPIRFDEDLSVSIQALGWRSGGRYLPRQDDIASVAYWYQTLPTAPFPTLPDKDYLEII